MDFIIEKNNIKINEIKTNNNKEKNYVSELHPVLEEEEIPAVTNRIFDQEKFELLEQKKHEKGKVFKIFVCDILCSQKCLVPYYHYKILHYEYSFIKVVGTVTEKSLNLTTDNITLAVDDGTGVIDCIIEKCQVDKLKYRNQHAELQLQSCIAIKPEVDTTKYGILNNATIKLLQFCKERLEEWGAGKEFQLGDTISIVGRVRDFFNRRVIFAFAVKKIANPIEPEERDYIREVTNVYIKEYL